MDEIDKFTWARTPILNVTLELDDFKKIHTLVQAQQAKIFERDKKTWIENNPDADKEKQKEIFDQADLDFRISTTVTYTNGEDVTFFDTKDFDKKNLRDNIKSVVVDSSRVNEFRYGKRLYPNVRVQIDLHDNSSFNPFAILTGGTQNESHIFVVGKDQDWCTRTQTEISNIISSRKNFRNPLHAKFVYDFSIFLICIPFFLAVLYKYNTQLKLFEQKYSLLLIYFSAFNVLMLILLSWRMLFDYIKWLWPSVELKESIGPRGWNRWALSLIPVSVVSVLGFVTNRIFG